MKTVKLIAVSALLFVGAFVAKAQDFATGYFLGGYQYAYRMNPAFPSEHNFFSLGLGQLGANIQSDDLGFSDFIKMNSSGKCLMFLDDQVSWNDFQSGLNPDINKLNLNTNVNLISRGAWDEEKLSFKTFDVAIKSTSNLALPYDLFRFLKDGTATSPQFDFSNTDITSRNYLEIAFGKTKIVKNKFSIGYRIKGLIGLANASLRMDQLNVDMSSNTWKIEGKGELSASVPFAEIGTDDNGYYDYDKFAINAGKLLQNVGLGAAGDLGVSINLFPWFTISGAVLDFGWVNWEDEILGTADYTGTNAIRYTDTGDSEGSSKFGSFMNSLGNIYKYKPVSSEARTAGGKWEQLPYRVNAGAELRLPFYQRLSVGALYTWYNGDFSFNSDDVLLSVNFTPFNFLSVSGSSRLGNMFKSFGAAINLHPVLFNLFAGVDVIPSKLMNVSSLFENIPDYAQQFVVVPAEDVHLNAYVGLSLALGKRQIDYRKMSKQIIKDEKEKAEAKAAEKKAKEEQKAKEKELKEYEKLQAEEAKAAEQKAKEDAKAAKIAEKEAAAQAKADEKAAKEAAAAEAKATKEAAEKAKAEAKAAKEAEKAAKAQEKAAKAAEKAAAKNAAVEAATAKMQAEKAAKAAEAEAAAAAAAAAQEAAKTEATAAEQLLETVLEPKAEEPAPAAEPKAEEAAPAAPAVFEFPNL